MNEWMKLVRKGFQEEVNYTLTFARYGHGWIEKMGSILGVGGQPGAGTQFEFPNTLVRMRVGMDCPPVGMGS